MKNKLLLPLAFCLLCNTLWAQHTISGTVTDAKTGETLIGATIYDTLSHKGTVTNQHGRYSLTLKDDKAVIRISFVGCETLFYPLDLGGNQRLDAKLQSTRTLQVVKIVGERTQHVESSIPSRIEIPVEQVRAIPMLFGETDVIKAIQLLPGVQNGNEGMAGMYVRGGGPDENLFMLDGVPMYNVNHLGGFFSAFNSDAVKNIQLYKGSFPARFGSRLSSVLDITTNNGNDKEIHGGISVGFISAKAYIEGPIVKEKTTFSVSARRTYGDVLLQPIIAIGMRAEGEDAKVNAGYYFYDLNAKVTHRFNERSRLYASYYMGDDDLYARYRVNDSYNYKSHEGLGYYWGNIVGSLRWNYELTPKLFMNLSGAYTRYRSNLKVTEEYMNRDNNYDYAFSLIFKSGIRDILGCADFDYTPTPDHSVKFGTHYTFHHFTPETASVKAEDNGTPEEWTLGKSGKPRPQPHRIQCTRQILPQPPTPPQWALPHQ